MRTQIIRKSELDILRRSVTRKSRTNATFRHRRVARAVSVRKPVGLSLVGPRSSMRTKAMERLRNGETQAEIARTYGVGATPIGRLDCAAT